MISKLTKAQESKIPEFITKWVNQASAPTDTQKATKAVKDIYATMGEESPLVIFGASPYATACMAALFFNLAQNFDKDQLGSQLDSQLGSQLYIQLRSQLGSQLGSQLYSQLGSQLDSQLGSQLDSQLYIDVVNKDWHMSIFWLAWAGWYDYGQYIGVEFNKKTYDLFMAFVSNVGFIIPYKGIAFVSEAPQSIVWDSAQRLSYDHGKAVEYKDGWGLYCLDGVTFQEEEWKKIVSQEFTLETIAKSNMGADKSAIAQKYLRPDRLLEAVKAKLIHTGEKGTQLYEVKNFMGTNRTQYCMKMKHPSIDREYIEWVHPEVGKQANADLAQCAAWRDKEGNPIPLEDYLLAIEG